MKTARSSLLIATILVPAAPASLPAQSGNQIEAQARAGSPAAMVKLGKVHEDNKAYADAMRWYRAAADKGSAEGMRLLGLLYYNSQGVSQDYSEAIKWFRMAAAKGNAVAMWNLGMMHYSGRGTRQSDGEAVKWYRLSVGKGNKGALYSLAFMNHEGRGTPRNYGEALRLFRLAADHGSAGALSIMASMYRNGRGVKVDMAEAYRLEEAAKSADPKKWRTFVPPLKPASMVPGRAEPRKTPPDWVRVSGNEGEEREYDRAHVLVGRVKPGSRDFKGEPMGDSIQIVFRDGSSLNLDCANSKYSMWDTYKNENWGGAMSAMPLASRFGGQYCPVIRELKCRPTFSSYDPPCSNEDY